MRGKNFVRLQIVIHSSTKDKSRTFIWQRGELHRKIFTCSWFNQGQIKNLHLTTRRTPQENIHLFLVQPRTNQEPSFDNEENSTGKYSLVLGSTKDKSRTFIWQRGELHRKIFTCSWFNQEHICWMRHRYRKSLNFSGQSTPSHPQEKKNWFSGLIFAPTVLSEVLLDQIFPRSFRLLLIYALGSTHRSSLQGQANVQKKC